MFQREALHGKNLLQKKKFPKKMKYLNFPVTNEISFKKAFQLNIPPYLTAKHINNLVKNIKSFVEIYKK